MSRTGTDVWEFVLNRYEAKLRVIMLYVVSSTGSSPGRTGFKMAVSSDMEIYGTIGGGVMEHKLTELSKSLFTDEKIISRVLVQKHDKNSGNRSGMICSGEQTIVIHEISEKDIPAIKCIIENDTKPGTLYLTNEGISFYSTLPETPFTFINTDENLFQFTERTGIIDELHIIGGGHCALALSALMKKLNFIITVYDDRMDLPTLNANIFADHIVNLTDYRLADNFIPEGENVYVAIMTVGYRTDDIVLRSVMNKNLKYLGILGSKAKLKKMFDQYRQEGIAENILSRIYAPIGMRIKSETADEIAVSIAAEVLAVRNNS